MGQVVNKGIEKYAERLLEADFETQMHDGNPIAISITESSLPWIICIGGLNQRMGMPVHEFVSVAKEVPSNRLFVRDISRLWYQSGLPGLARNFEEAGKVIGELLEYVGANHRMAVGSSAGGFAAMGWANSLRLDSALLFSPQSSISPIDKFWHDRRWLKFVWKAWIKKASALDVAKDEYFSNARPVRVIYPNMIASDRFQAERLKDLPGVELDPRKSDNHSIVRDLRDSGELFSLLADGLRPPL